jgi:hypothetical protein
MTSQTRTQTTANSIINTFVEDIFDKGDGNDLLFSGCHYHPLRSLPSPDMSLKWMTVMGDGNDNLLYKMYISDNKTTNDNYSTVKWQQHSLSHRSPSSDYSLYHYALWLQTFLLTFLWLTLFGEQYCHNVVYNNENREILACFYMKIARFLVRFSSAFQRFLSDAPRL